MGTSTSTTVELVRVDEPLNATERGAIAGFLAGYTGNTLISYTTDLRLFVDWCVTSDHRLFEVRRAHLGNRMQPRRQRPPAQGRYRVPHPRARSQRTRRSPRPGRARQCAGSCVDLAPRVERVADQRALGADAMDMDRGHRTLAIVRKGGKHVVIPLAPRTGRTLDLYIDERTTEPVFLGVNGQRMDRYAADRTVKRLAKRAGITKRISPHSLRHSYITAVSTPVSHCVMSKKPPATPTPEPRCATTVPASRWTPTPPTSSQRSSPERHPPADHQP